MELRAVDINLPVKRMKLPSAIAPCEVSIGWMDLYRWDTSRKFGSMKMQLALESLKCHGQNCESANRDGKMVRLGVRGVPAQSL